MQSFKDKEGTEWIIDINLSHIKYIESIDFSELTNGEHERIRFLPPQEDLFTSVITNPGICFEIVWACCREQAEKRGITSEDEFAKRFDGRSLQESRVAVYEELPPFFPENATTLKALIERYSKIQTIADKRLREMLDRKLGEEEMEGLIKEQMDNLEYSIDMILEDMRKKSIEQRTEKKEKE